VSAYTIGSATGALTLVGSVQTGDEPYSIAVEPFGKFAYVANKGSDSISVYSINSATGALTLIDANGSVVGAQSSIATGVGSVGDAPISVTVHPSGKFAYVVNQGNAVDTGNAITAYTIDTAGALSVMADVDGGKIGAQTSILTGTLPYAIAVDPAGRFAYVANDTSNNVSAYKIDQTTGALTQVDADGTVAGIQNFAAGTNPRAVAIDPAGKCALVANGGSDNVKSYTINATTGALANVSTVISRSAGSAPRSVAIDPATGTFAYVANAGGNTVVGASWATGTATFTTNAAHGYKPGDVIHVSNVVTATGYNGTFTVLTVPLPTTFTVSITANPGTWISGGTIAEGSVSAFSLDPNTCAITLMDTFTAGTTPFSISIDPSGKYVYVANFGSNNVSAYSIDNTGALTALAGSPFSSGLGPVSVTTAQ
jgi:6-phosphogluconolactonase (cycloisomerase 2 family)